MNIEFSDEAIELDEKICTLLDKSSLTYGEILILIEEVRIQYLQKYVDTVNKFPQ